MIIDGQGGRESLRTQLRRASAVAHARLDDAFAHGHNSPESYLGLIRCLHSFHEAADPLLIAWVERSAQAPRVTVTDRSAAFRTDLMALGYAPLAPMDLSDLTTLTESATLDDGVGIALLYVVAGSSLGARVVLRQLPHTVPANARKGLTEASGVEALHLWQHTAKALEAAVSAEVSTVAKETCAQLFDRLARHMTVGSSTGSP